MIRATLAIVLFVVVTGLILGGFGVPWTIENPEWQARMIRGLEGSTGLTVRARGPLTLVLLPVPTLQLHAVTIAGAGNALTAETDTLSVRVSVRSLLSGELRAAAATLQRPVIEADVDRLWPLANAMVDAARHGTPAALHALLQTRRLAVRGAVIRLHSHDPRIATTLEDVYGSWSWPAGSPATLSGRATWHGERGHVLVTLDRPQDALAGVPTAGYLRIRSALLDLVATGHLGFGTSLSGAGRLKASTDHLSHFLKMAGTPFPALDAVAEGRLEGEWSLPGEVLDVRNARLELDDMLFEGDMAFHQTADHPGLSGTLATDRIDLDPFLRPLPTIKTAGGGWNETPLQIQALAFDDIDIRISASQATLGALRFEDGGLSLQSGGGRLEFSLGEARSYDGLIKGRLIAAVEDGRTKIRAEANMSQFNVGALFGALGLGSSLTGTSTAHVALEAAGDSVQALVGSATGTGEVNVRDGALKAGLLGQLIRTSTGIAGPRGDLGPFAFDSATIGISVDHGVAHLAKGDLTRNDQQSRLSGSVSFPDQTIDCVAETQSTTRPGAGSSMRLSGAWGWLDLSPAGNRPSDGLPHEQ